jgi:hypothetical protein
MKRCDSSHKAEGREESIEPEDMVAVKVADEDVVYLAKADPVAPELHLSSLSAVY